MKINISLYFVAIRSHWEECETEYTVATGPFISDIDASIVRDQMASQWEFEEWEGKRFVVVEAELDNRHIRECY